MKEDNKFPILKSNPKEYIPWDIIIKHERQALKNHGQTIQRLAERGGLSWSEAYSVLTDDDYASFPDEYAREKVLRICHQGEWVVPVVWEVCGFVKAKGGTAEEAVEYVNNHLDEYSLPYRSEYIDGSFEVSGDIEEASAMSESYTTQWREGRWGGRDVFKGAGE